jgi:hypothetical protein
MTVIHVEIDPTVEPQLRDLAAALPEEIEIVSPQRFDGTISLGQALVTLTVASIPWVAKIVLEAIKSKKHVVIKTKGITISGFSETNAIQVLEKILHGD